MDLYLIDQHAAHERVLFEKLMAQHDEKEYSIAIFAYSRSCDPAAAIREDAYITIAIPKSLWL